MEKLKLELDEQKQQCQEQEESVKQASAKLAQSEKVHAMDKEQLSQLTGKGLESMNSEALEKLEEIHIKGLKSVGVAKVFRNFLLLFIY